MLILTRRLNEKIMIDDNIILEIQAINNHTVSIGIEAPIEVKIYREEVFNKLKNSSDT